MSWEFRIWFELAMRMLAKEWGCPVSSNPSRTKFLFHSSVKPTLCLIHTGLKLPNAWNRADFGDFVKMRWERCLGIPQDDFKPLSVLTENYEQNPPYCAAHISRHLPFVYLIDYYQIPCDAPKQDILELIASRYADGLGGSNFPDVPGVHLGISATPDRNSISLELGNHGLPVIGHFGDLFASLGPEVLEVLK